MKRKLLRISTCLMCACMLCMGAAGAKGSIQNNGSVATDEIMIDGKKVDSSKITAGFNSSFVEAGVPAEIISEINVINEDPSKITEILKEAVNVSDGAIQAEDLKLLTEVQDLSLIDQTTGEIIKDAKNVTITWEVVNLVEGMGELRVLHYSTVRNVWELITPDQVDYVNKAITATFPDLSPVAVVYVPADKGNGSQGSTNQNKPQSSDAIKNTASDAGHTAMTLMGVLLIGGAVLAITKTRKKA